MQVTAAGRFAAVTARVHGWGQIIDVYYLPTGRLIARLVLEGSTRVSKRFADRCLCVGDDRGRVIVLDLRTGALRRDLRSR